MPNWRRGGVQLAELSPEEQKQAFEEFHELITNGVTAALDQEDIRDSPMVREFYVMTTLTMAANMGKKLGLSPLSFLERAGRVMMAVLKMSEDQFLAEIAPMFDKRAKA